MRVGHSPHTYLTDSSPSTISLPKDNSKIVLRCLVNQAQVIGWLHNLAVWLWSHVTTAVSAKAMLGSPWCLQKEMRSCREIQTMSHVIDSGPLNSCSWCRQKKSKGFCTPFCHRTNTAASEDTAASVEPAKQYHRLSMVLKNQPLNRRRWDAATSDSSWSLAFSCRKLNTSFSSNSRSRFSYIQHTSKPVWLFTAMAYNRLQWVRVCVRG